MEELQAKVREYEEKIARLQAQIEKEDENDTFGRMNIMELERDIKACEKSIKNLQDRINGTEAQGPSDYQMRCAEYVNSDAYDND